MEVVLGSIVVLAAAFWGPRLARRPGVPHWVSVVVLLLAIVLTVTVIYIGAQHGWVDGGG